MIVKIGDIHKDFKWLAHTISKYDIRDASIIQVGDFGVGFTLKKKDMASLRFLNKQALQRNNHLYVIRGNHDDPSWFQGNIKFSNVNLLKDYSVLTLDNQRVLFVGGAVSIDRLPNLLQKDEFGRPWKGRTEGRDYWKDETFVLDENKIRELRNIDIVITHSCPFFAFPFGFAHINNWINNDPELYNDLMNEREDIGKMYEILKENGNNIKKWYYGHYHMYNKMDYQGTDFILIDKNMIYEY